MARPGSAPAEPVTPGPAITRVGPGYGRWAEVLDLIRAAFATMEGRIDPPSSVHRLTLEAMAAMAAEGAVFVMEEGARPVGCVFCRRRGERLYLTKLAVSPQRQRAGLGRALLAAAEAEARARGLVALEVQTRIELAETHAAFGALGFIEVGRTAHPGFDRPTSITLQRWL